MVKNLLFIDLSNKKHDPYSLYPEFLQKSTSFKLTPKRLTLLKKLALVITHAALFVTRNGKNSVRVLGRGAQSKSTRHFPSASLSESFTNVTITCLEMRSGII